MMVPPPSKSAEVFAGLSRTPDNPWVFSGRKKGTRPINLNDSWDRVCKRTGLDGVRLHDLRHRFASRALALGESLPMIGDLLGYRTVQRRDTPISHAIRRRRSRSGPSSAPHSPTTRCHQEKDRRQEQHSVRWLWNRVVSGMLTGRVTLAVAVTSRGASNIAWKQSHQSLRHAATPPSHHVNREQLHAVCLRLSESVLLFP